MKGPGQRKPVTHQSCTGGFLSCGLSSASSLSREGKETHWDQSWFSTAAFNSDPSRLEGSSRAWPQFSHLQWTLAGTRTGAGPPTAPRPAFLEGRMTKGPILWAHTPQAQASQGARGL